MVKERMISNGHDTVEKTMDAYNKATAKRNEIQKVTLNVSDEQMENAAKELAQKVAELENLEKESGCNLSNMKAYIQDQMAKTTLTTEELDAIKKGTDLMLKKAEAAAVKTKGSAKAARLAKTKVMSGKKVTKKYGTKLTKSTGTVVAATVVAGGQVVIEGVKVVGGVVVDLCKVVENLVVNSCNAVGAAGTRVGQAAVKAVDGMVEARKEAVQIKKEVKIEHCNNEIIILTADKALKQAEKDGKVAEKEKVEDIIALIDAKLTELQTADINSEALFDSVKKNFKDTTSRRKVAKDKVDKLASEIKGLQDKIRGIDSEIAKHERTIKTA